MQTEVSGRRKSSVLWTRLGKLGARGGRSTATSAGVPPSYITGQSSALLELPGEVFIDIVGCLDFDEISALRATCKVLNELVTGDHSAVARFLAIHSRSHTCRLLAVPIEDGKHWREVVQERRIRAQVKALARQLVVFIQYHTLLDHNAQRQLRFQPVGEKVSTRLRERLLPIAVYLHRVHSFRPGQAAPNASLSTDPADRVSAYRESILARISPQDLAGMRDIWRFLLWILGDMLECPRYATALERKLRGWNADEFDAEELPSLLALGELSVMKSLLDAQSFKDRRMRAKKYRRDLAIGQIEQQPERQRNESSRVGDGTQQPTRAPAIGNPSERSWLYEVLQIFDNCGSGADSLEESRRPGASQTLALLNELAGYDLGDMTAQNAFAPYGALPVNSWHI